jgi:Zn-dependent protease with chaperone function
MISLATLAFLAATWQDPASVTTTGGSNGTTTAAPAQPSPTQKTAQSDEAKHQRDIDIDVKLGKEYSADIDKETKPSEDKAIIERVQRIGNELAEIANATPITSLWGDKRMSKFPYVFKVIQGKDVNAFSLPGGTIYVYEGLAKYVESDDELAGVLSHEISHASLRHVATLQREQSKLSIIQLPLLLLTLLSGRPEALMTGSLISNAIGSGWSVNAEKAADYGGFQYMVRSRYNPTGLLTFMERLARDEKSGPQIDYGIYRTHPPGRERAESLESFMRANNISIRRSVVTTSFRTSVEPGENGNVNLLFGKRPLFALAGSDAIARGDDATVKLNTFFDSQPQLYEVVVTDDGWIMGRRQALARITPEDAAAAKQSFEDYRAGVLKQLRASIFSLSYRIWYSR